MRGGRLEVRVTEAPKNLQVIIGGRVAMKMHVRNLTGDGGRWASVKKIGRYR